MADTPRAEPKQVVAGVLEQGGRILICQRRDDQPFAGQWEFPGGKIEAGETREAALRRELQEELGITAEIGKELATVRHQYAEGLFVELHFFTVPDFQNAIQNRIFREVRWEVREKLLPETFLEADRGIVERLRRSEL